MAIPNLVALLILSPVIAKETKKYLWDNNLEEISSEPAIVIEENNNNITM